MNADEILAVDLDEPERLFPGDAPGARDVYHNLAKAWHPDVSTHPKSGDVIAHLNRLYDEALRRINAGMWKAWGKLTITGTDGKTRGISYARKRMFELGEMYYGRENLTYIVRQEFKDLHAVALKLIRGLSYTTPSMQKEISRYMPKIRTAFTATTGDEVLVLEKTHDAFLARDLLEYADGHMDPKHVAWIVSATFNVLCYLDHAGLTHNALGPDTVFVSPQHHSVMLYGGWWYAAKAGGTLRALPPWARSMCPREILADKRADVALDLLLINAFGRELLGDRSGMSLTGVPDPMLRALRMPPMMGARTGYVAWFKALKDSFGERRFVKLDVEESDIYNQGAQ